MKRNDIGLPQSPAQAAEGGLSLIEAAIVEALGERCTIDGGPSDPDCLTCRTWTAFDALSAEGSANAAAARLAAEEMREQFTPVLALAIQETLWHAYNQGIERDGKWMDGALSDATYLQDDLGLEPGWHDAEAMKAAIPGLAMKKAEEAIRSLPLPPSSPEDQEKAKAAAIPTIADPDGEARS